MTAHLQRNILRHQEVRKLNSALSFQDESEVGGFQQLTMIGELMSMFRSRCETRYQPGKWLSLDEM